MNRPLREILIVLFVATIGLGFAAFVHAVEKMPPERFLGHFQLPQGIIEGAGSLEELNGFLGQKEEEFLGSSITLTTDRGELSSTLRELGVGVDSQSIRLAFQYFFEEANSLEKVQTYLFGHQFDYPLTLDFSMLEAALAPTGIEQGVKDAGFEVKGSLISVSPEQIGYGIDETQLLAELQSSWNQDFSSPERIELKLHEKLPQRRSEDFEAKLPLAQAISKNTYTLQDEYGQTWSLPMEYYMAWIDLDEAGDITIKPALFETFVVEEVASYVEQEKQSVKITTNEEGEVEFDGSARFGKRVNREQFIQDLSTRFVNDDNSYIEIPVDVEQPEVEVSDDLAERGITDLVSVGYSNFTGSSQDRIHNVNRGMAQFNGDIIKQGETFSFTSLMGPIDAANGWRSELVILGDKTEKQYGGGLCQVSSTMFRAALFGGLPIDARKNHSYWVSYYGAPFGAGLDATVYDPLPDLKFTNDTAGDILIQGYIDGYDAYFVFYGSNDARHVKMEGPYNYEYQSIEEPKITFVDWLEPGVRQREEYAHTGFKTDWYRTITFADGTSLEKERFHSDYEARPAKYFEGRPYEERTETSE